jgi:hypothetical protein
MFLHILFLWEWLSLIFYFVYSFRSLAKAELLKEAENAERRAEFKKLKKKRKSRLVSALLGSVSYT